MDDRTCRRLFGRQYGDEVHEKIEALSGGTCPCMSDQTCPLLRIDGTTPLLPIPTQRQPSREEASVA